MGKLNITKFREAIAAGDLKYIKPIEVGGNYKGFDIFKFKVKTEDDVTIYGLEISKLDNGYEWFYSWGLEAYHFSISFEDLFEILPKEIQDEFLFNLDIFSGKEK